MVCFNLWLLSNLAHYNLCIVQYYLSLSRSGFVYQTQNQVSFIGISMRDYSFCCKEWQIVNIANKNVNKLRMGIEYDKIFNFDALRVN